MCLAEVTRRGTPRLSDGAKEVDLQGPVGAEVDPPLGSEAVLLTGVQAGSIMS